VAALLKRQKNACDSLIATVVEMIAVVVEVDEDTRKEVRVLVLVVAQSAGTGRSAHTDRSSFASMKHSPRLFSRDMSQHLATRVS